MVAGVVDQVPQARPGLSYSGVRRGPWNLAAAVAADPEPEGFAAAFQGWLDRRLACTDAVAPWRPGALELCVA